MAMNREQKRMLRRQGEVDEHGDAVRTRRQPPPPRTRDERASVGQFLREVRGELRKVAWPSREEVINYSIIVFVVVVAITGFIAGLDWLFAESLLKLFDR